LVDISHSDSESSSSSSSPNSTSGPEVSGSSLGNIQVDNEIELRRDIRKNRRESFLVPASDDSVIFEYSYDSSNDSSKASGKAESEQSSAPRTSLFRKPSEMSDDEETNEEIQNQNSFRDIQSWEDEKDMMIFIQMAPYPMTLEDFIWSEQRANSEARLQHCFHWQITAGMLLAILDGVEYIHGQDIVHRDLKPSNIFLSIQSGKYRPEGSVDVTGCTHCDNTSGTSDHTFVTPHIGDFGLIAKVNGSSSPKKTTFTPSPLAVLSSVASSRQPGTKFYSAPKNEESYKISPKLDVYSIGIIACEMLIQFGTRSERLVVLNDFNDGKLDALKGSPMETGIKGMLEHDVEKRWSCADVRTWLGDILSHD
jgi:translation initiation factor 2-alpha kinase 3